jgi:hypothetical protein
MEKRLAVWEKLASNMKPAKLNKEIVHEISFEEIPSNSNGEVRGRTIVKM